VFRKALSSVHDVISSYLLESEVYAAVARESRPSDAVAEALQGIQFVALGRSLRAEYERVFSVGYCRGADAHHLATALFLDPSAKEIVFVTADKRQAGIARKLGFKIVG
jgi:hypothetical protein